MGSPGWLSRCDEHCQVPATDESGDDRMEAQGLLPHVDELVMEYLLFRGFTKVRAQLSVPSARRHRLTKCAVNCGVTELPGVRGRAPARPRARLRRGPDPLAAVAGDSVVSRRSRVGGRSHVNNGTHILVMAQVPGRVGAGDVEVPERALLPPSGRVLRRGTSAFVTLELVCAPEDMVLTPDAPL